MKMTHAVALMVAVTTAALSFEASAQQYVYPSKGQSPETQKNDEAACYSWAVQQSGFDPAQPAAPTQQTGVTRGSGVRGAAGGAIVGNIVGGDSESTGKGALAGAVGARMISRHRNNSAARQEQAAVSHNQVSFTQARSACLQGRGYTVR